MTAIIEEVETSIKQGLAVKDVQVLPVYQGFLALCKSKPPYIIWIHNSFVEGLVLTALNVARELSEEAIFDLVPGGFILKKAYKSIFPVPPTGTAFFYPKTHDIQLGEFVIVKEGTITGAVDSVTQITTDILKAGITAGKSVTDKLADAISTGEDRAGRETAGPPEEDATGKDEDMKLCYIKFQDHFRSYLTAKLKKEGSMPDKTVSAIQRMIKTHAEMEFSVPAGDALDRFIYRARKAGFAIEEMGLTKKFLPF